MGKAKNILKGKFPSRVLTLDEQIAVINKIGAKLFERFSTGESEDKIDTKVNNLALWLGGLHPDIQVYAFQLLLNYYQIEFDANDKTEARMARLEERIGIGTKPGIKEYSYERINHYAWPVEFLDGTTFEDRLEDLAKEVREEQDLDIVTVDMVLTGVHTSTVEDIAQAYALVVACIDHIDQPFAVRQAEQIQRFSSWLEFQVPDIKLFGQSLVSKIAQPA